MTASTNLRCSLLSSFTLDAVAPSVNALLREDGIDLDWYICPFGQYPQAILQEDSELYRFRPQVVFLAIDAEDLFTQLPDRFVNATTRRAAANERLEGLLGLIRTLAGRMPATTIVVHSMMRLRPSAHPLLAYKSTDGPALLIDRANLALAELALELSNVYLLDLSGELPPQSFDARYYYLAKMRLGHDALSQLASLYRRVLLAQVGRRKKCFVLDLDNTLWGGIVGEDGVENLEVSEDGPGRAYQDFQRVLLEYRNTGTLLAICSKNDESLAMTALGEHPGMLLKPDDFVAMRINWQDKAANLRSLAAELNLGLDSFLFLDDSPHERALVRQALPEVTVPDFPQDPSDLPDFAAKLPWFDTLRVTEEDRQRSALYQQEQQRGQLRNQTGSLEEFLRSLDIEVEVRQADSFALPRVAQLTQRTNQFNLTTRRYTVDDLRQMLDRGNWRIYVARTCDRIGDAGIVGAAIVDADPAGRSARLDTFLMSCRVLGRGIESAFLGAVAKSLRDHAEVLEAEFIPTPRNAVCAGFLAEHGFDAEEGRFRGQVPRLAQGCPAWIRLRQKEAQS